MRLHTFALGHVWTAPGKNFLTLLQDWSGAVRRIGNLLNIAPSLFIIRNGQLIHASIGWSLHGLERDKFFEGVAMNGGATSAGTPSGRQSTICTHGIE